MSNEKRVSKEQILDWIENPVTECLAGLLKEELQSIQDTPITDTLVYGEPIKTHENLVELEARESAWGDLAAFLGGDWSYFEEEEDEYQ